MPRKARPTQPIAAPQDQGYGQRGDQMAAQHAIPLPNNAGATANNINTPAPAPGQAPGGPVDLSAALEAARQMAPPQGGLDRPSDQPNTPVTAGAPTGPGVGTEALNVPIDPVLDYLRAAYRSFNSPAIAALIEAASANTPVNR